MSRHTVGLRMATRAAVDISQKYRIDLAEKE